MLNKELDFMLENLYNTEPKIYKFSGKITSLPNRKFNSKPFMLVGVIVITLFMVLFLRPVTGSLFVSNPQTSAATSENATTPTDPTASTKNVITGIDNFSVLWDSDWADPANNSYDETNLSGVLKQQMDTFQDTVNYKIVIAGMNTTGEFFKNYSYNGYTYEEYYNNLYKAELKLKLNISTNAPSHDILEIVREIQEYEAELATFNSNFNTDYTEKYGTVYYYLLTNYDFISNSPPVDLKNISSKDYQMLATASFDVINQLAKDNFWVFIAPEEE